MFFNNEFNTFFGLNLTLVYTFPMCMAWRFHFPIRNYDFNYNYKLDETLSSNPLHQIEILYGRRQLINSPTRVTLTTSTLIDVMFSTEHESHVVTGVSDHYMMYTIYSKIAHKTRLHKEIMFRNYKRFRNALSQNDSISNTSWSADQFVDKWNNFKDAFIDISNNCAPMETRR